MSPTICIPDAHGVPGAGGPPDWWLAGSGPPQIDNLRKLRNDPRWRGAARVGIPGAGVATGNLCTVRALRSGQHLHLAFHVHPAPEVHPEFDRVWIAYHQAGQSAQMVRIPAGDATGPFEPKPVGTGVVWYQSSARPFGPLPDLLQQAGPPPAWVAETARAWVRDGEWALHLRLPLPNGARIAALVQDGWTTTGSIVDYRFPHGLGLPNTADSNQWATVSPPGDAACQGVSLELFHFDQNTGQPVFHVGTTNTPSSRINGGQANTFFAMPSNRTGNPIPADGSLRARFRIANWGSVVAGGPWQQIIPDPNTPNPAPSNTAPIPALPAAGVPSVSITGSWTAPTIPAGTIKHECVLVELEGAHSFTQDSVYCNCDIVGASRFEREAEISVAGLLPSGDSRRTVYLYVDAQQMPARVEPRPDPEPGAGFARGVRGEDGNGGENGDGEFPPPDPITLDEYARTRPSYRVYVFHETGERWRFENEDAVLLAPQSAFGFLVDHDGPLYGWEHRLSGRGLRRIAPNLYRLRVPEGGSAKVVTRIVAHERRPPWWRNCLLTVLAFLGSIAGAVVALLRRLLGR